MENYFQEVLAKEATLEAIKAPFRFVHLKQAMQEQVEGEAPPTKESPQKVQLQQAVKEESPVLSLFLRKGKPLRSGPNFPTGTNMESTPGLQQFKEQQQTEKAAGLAIPAIPKVRVKPLGKYLSVKQLLRGGTPPTPKTLADVLGQESAKKTLARARLKPWEPPPVAPMRVRKAPPVKVVKPNVGKDIKLKALKLKLQKKKARS